MITSVSRTRLDAAIAIVACMLAGCSSTEEDARTIPAEHPAPMLDERPCGSDSGRCPSDGGSGAAREAEAVSSVAEGRDSSASTDAEEEAASPDLTSCRFDSDCIAVPKVGCCRLGFEVAVNRNEVQGYQDSFTCTESRPICPLYIVVDRRIPECDNATHRCTMISVDRIACGGFIRNQHRCPQGYLCDLHGRPPDIPGVCIAEMEDD